MTCEPRPHAAAATMIKRLDRGSHPYSSKFRSGGDWPDGSLAGTIRPSIPLTPDLWVVEIGRHVIPRDLVANLPAVDTG